MREGSVCPMSFVYGQIEASSDLPSIDRTSEKPIRKIDRLHASKRRHARGFCASRSMITRRVWQTMDWLFGISPHSWFATSERQE